LNGVGVGEHVGGHIGFEFELTGSVKVGANQVTVAVNNTLTNHTLPQGFTSHTNQTFRYLITFFICWPHNSRTEIELGFLLSLGKIQHSFKTGIINTTPSFLCNYFNKPLFF
jgi:hypothetical protein